MKSKNFVPVKVWKQERRKYWVSRDSIPVAAAPGFGRVVPPEEEGTRGVSDFVMACTLLRLGFCELRNGKGAYP